MSRKALIEVRNVTIAYGSNVIMRDLTFDVGTKEIFVIMGGSGCGKSTLLKSMIGLREPTVGEILYDGVRFTGADEETRTRVQRSIGVLYQQGALWGSMTLRENIALPLEQYTSLSKGEIDSVVSYKLALVGLKGFQDYFPSELSGGRRKRAGLARAMALDPQVLFFDEPSAGLDPISSRLLDDLILQLRDSLGATIVIVTHELASIFAIADRCIFLDVETKTLLAQGNPAELARKGASDPNVYKFLRRGDGAQQET
ncbi:MAG: phospholipid/cholesterol/gamma-HCH transport system ATP-binding protein [Verrucomicrobiales bacterium]